MIFLQLLLALEEILVPLYQTAIAQCHRQMINRRPAPQTQLAVRKHRSGKL